MAGESRQDVVRYDLEMMLKDSRRWREAAGALRQARDAANGLTLGMFEFSNVAVVASKLTRGESIVDVYGELQQKMTRLLTEGETCFSSMADRLRRVAENAAETEDVNRDVIQDIERALDGQV